MVETELNMYLKKSFALLCALVLGFTAAAQETGSGRFTWSRVRMDGSRTGASILSADNIEAAAGRFDGATYVAPNGRRFRAGSATAAAAHVLLDAQPAVAHVKQVIGYAPEAMVRQRPECALSDLYVDQLMASVERSSGRPVDFAVANFGGIRIDMPEGDILLDDILSMFPFKNYTCYLQLRGRDIRAILEQFAATGFQVVGGVRCTVRDGRLVSVTIGGRPLEDDRVYGVATISFLLNGGDNIHMARNALALEMYDVKMSDFMVGYVLAETAAGRPITYAADGRVIVEE